MTGYSYEEYLKHGGWLAHIHPDDVERDARDMTVLQKGQSVRSEIRTYKRDGSLRWVQVSAQPVWDQKQDKLSGIVGAVKDITDRKQAEEALQKSEATYRQAIEIAGAVPYRQTFDENGGIIYDFMSEGIRQITGYGPEEFNDNLWGLLVQERNLLEDLAPYSLDEAIQRVRSGKNAIWKCEHCIKARDGKIHWVFEAAVDLRDEQGIAYGSVGMYQDITERKQAEEALRYERDLLQVFIDNIPDSVYFKDIESRFIRINKTLSNFLNLQDPQDAIGKTNLDFQSHERAQEFMSEEKRIIATGQLVLTGSNLIQPKMEVHAGSQPPRCRSKTSEGRVIGTIGISRDITLQKQADAEREALINELETKNAELERFTYTVSHDLKSPLVTITGFLGYLEKDALTGNKEKIKGSINRISKAAEKMQALLNDLLELSRVGRLMNAVEDIPFEEIVNEAVEHVQGRSG